MVSADEKAAPKPPVYFRAVYVAAVALLLLSMLMGVNAAVVGSAWSGNKATFEGLMVSAILMAVILGAPAAILLFLVTLWRVIWYKRRRLAFVLLLIPLGGWGYVGIVLMLLP